MVHRTGAGPRRAEAFARQHALALPSRLLIAGVCGSLHESLAPGAVVVADTLLGPGEPVRCDRAEGLAARLLAGGLEARVGAIQAADHVVRGAEREALAESGALAVDMESYVLARGLRAGPAGGHERERSIVVLRVVSDAPGRELFGPRGLFGGLEALRVLRRAVAELASAGPWSGRDD